MVLRWNWLVALCLSFVFFQKSFAWETKPKFTKQKIEISFKKIKKIIELEVAETMEQHAYGLMNRTSMPVDAGMLFKFNDEQIREFWMKNTLIDLDIAYVDAKFKIIDIQNMKAAKSVMQTALPTYPSKLPAQYAIEMNSGWFKKNKFDIGSQVKILSGPTSKAKN